MKYRIQHNVKLSRLGRRDVPPNDGWKTKYKNFPVERLKIGHSFNTEVDYDYGRAVAIKQACWRQSEQKTGKRMGFAVREWHGKIRVWRTK